LLINFLDLYNTEAIVDSSKSRILSDKHQDLYYNSLKRSEKIKKYENIKKEKDQRLIRKKPKINKNSKKIIRKDAGYEPIHKRTNKVINKNKVNIAILKNQIVRTQELKNKQEQEEYEKWKKKANKRTELHSPSRMKMRKGALSSQNFKEFYKNEERFVTERAQKQEEAKQKREDISFSFKPKIKEYSPYRGVISNRRKCQPVWERLYGLANKNNGIFEDKIMNTFTERETSERKV